MGIHIKICIEKSVEKIENEIIAYINAIADCEYFSIWK